MNLKPNVVPLEPGGFYHIYNRGNNFQDTFVHPADYQTFLNKWREFVLPVAKTFAYSLLPNHFHALVQLREVTPDLGSPKDLASSEGKLAKSDTGEQPNQRTLIQRGFTNFFISYARTMQNRHGFHGAVFHSPFKRKVVQDDFHFDHLVAYIHYNARKHGIFLGPLHEYSYSSYRALITTHPTLLDRAYVLNHFGGIERFIAFHESMEGYFDLKEDWER